MSQLPLFEDAAQTHPPAQSRSAGEAPIARPSVSRPQPRFTQSRSDKRSPRPKRPSQQPLLAPSAATVVSIPTTIAPQIDRPLPPAPLPAKELPPGWVDPSDPAFKHLRNCRLCGAPIKTGGLDHSLCSGDCGYVIDLIWQARQQRLKRSKEPEPQAATHTEHGESETLDLFTYGLDRDTSDVDGGAA